VTVEGLPLNDEEDVEIGHDLHHFSKSRGHNAGITAILPIPTSRHYQLLLTGSYDDCIRVYSMNSNTILAELPLGGGIWRLKFLQDYELCLHHNPDEKLKFRVLASCMHAGARILQVTGTLEGGERSWNIEILGSVTEHKSICYASDVQPLSPWVPGMSQTEYLKNGGEENRLCVSTSFYDRLLCVWNFDPEKLPAKDREEADKGLSDTSPGTDSENVRENVAEGTDDDVNDEHD